MNKLRLLFRVLLPVVVALVTSSLAQAQATRTWVSGVGDDANPCSRTAPCKTFAGAISKTAGGGEIDALDPGGFGAVTITKSITIDGTGNLASTLASGVNGIVINIAGEEASKTVRLRGLTINGAGTGTNGIRIVAANKVSIEDSVIDGFANSGISIEAASTQVLVRNTVIRNNQGAGINSPSGSQVLLSECSLSFNGVAVTAPKGGVTGMRNNAVFGNKKDGDSIALFEAR